MCHKSLLLKITFVYLSSCRISESLGRTRNVVRSPATRLFMSWTSTWQSALDLRGCCTREVNIDVASSLNRPWWVSCSHSNLKGVGTELNAISAWTAASNENEEILTETITCSNIRQSCKDFLCCEFFVFFFLTWPCQRLHADLRVKKSTRSLARWCDGPVYSKNAAPEKAGSQNHD